MNILEYMEKNNCVDNIEKVIVLENNETINISKCGYEDLYSLTFKDYNNNEVSFDELSLKQVEMVYEEMGNFIEFLKKEIKQ